MAGTRTANRQVIKSFFKNIGRQVVQETGKTVNDTIYIELAKYCENLLLDAVIENRRRNPNAHQFTGNLINSIVVILFDKSEGSIDTFFAYDRLKNPIRREMSALTTRGTLRKNKIRFSPDWQNAESAYRPQVVTDESYGQDDARAFASSWRPSTGKQYEICVAYTSEYAEWVELHNQSIGYANSVAYVKRTLPQLGFKKVS